MLLLRLLLSSRSLTILSVSADAPTTFTASPCMVTRPTMTTTTPVHIATAAHARYGGPTYLVGRHTVTYGSTATADRDI